MNLMHSSNNWTTNTATIKREQLVSTIQSTIDQLNPIHEKHQKRFSDSVDKGVAYATLIIGNDDLIGDVIAELHQYWWHNNLTITDEYANWHAAWYRQPFKKFKWLWRTDKVTEQPPFKEMLPETLAQHIKKERERAVIVFDEIKISGYQSLINTYFGHNRPIAELLIGEKLDKDSARQITTIGDHISKLNLLVKEITSAEYDNITVCSDTMAQLSEAQQYVKY